MEDKEIKRKLAKIPDADKNGDPIYKIDNLETDSGKQKAEKERKVTKDGRR